MTRKINIKILSFENIRPMASTYKILVRTGMVCRLTYLSKRSQPHQSYQNWLNTGLEYKRYASQQLFGSPIADIPEDTIIVLHSIWISLYKLFCRFVMTGIGTEAIRAKAACSAGAISMPNCLVVGITWGSSWRCFFITCFSIDKDPC